MPVRLWNGEAYPRARLDRGAAEGADEDDPFAEPPPFIPQIIHCPFIVQLAALLHDLDDWKFNESVDETPLRARAWLESCRVDIPTAETICGIITQISYKGAGVEAKWDH